MKINQVLQYFYGAIFAAEWLPLMHLPNPLRFIHQVLIKPRKATAGGELIKSVKPPLPIVWKGQARLFFGMSDIKSTYSYTANPKIIPIFFI